VKFLISDPHLNYDHVKAGATAGVSGSGQSRLCRLPVFR
jgi:hypothetical protein